MRPEDPATVLRVRPGPRRYPNCHLMFSGHYAYSSWGFPYLDLKDLVWRGYRAFGPDRVLWGSDYPLVVDDPGYPETLSSIDYLLDGIDSTARAKTWVGTRCASSSSTARPLQGYMTLSAREVEVIRPAADRRAVATVSPPIIAGLPR